MTDYSILLTNATINFDECVVKEKEDEKEKIKYKIRPIFHPKEKNVKEFKVEECRNHCGCIKGLDAVELDVLRMEGNTGTLKIYSYEIKRSDNINTKTEIQMMRQSLLLTVVATYGFRINLNNSCIYLDTSRGMVKILVKLVNGSSEGNFKKLPSREMINELENKVTKVFSDIDIYFDKSLNAFDIDFRINLRSGIPVYRYHIPRDMRNVYLEIVGKYGKEIASEIIMSRGKEDLSYLLAVYPYRELEKPKKSKKLGLEYLRFL